MTRNFILCWMLSEEISNVTKLFLLFCTSRYSFPILYWSCCITTSSPILKYQFLVESIVKIEAIYLNTKKFIRSVLNVFLTKYHISTRFISTFYSILICYLFCPNFYQIFSNFRCFFNRWFWWLEITTFSIYPPWLFASSWLMKSFSASRTVLDNVFSVSENLNAHVYFCLCFDVSPQRNLHAIYSTSHLIFQELFHFMNVFPPYSFSEFYKSSSSKFKVNKFDPTSLFSQSLSFFLWVLI